MARASTNSTNVTSWGDRPYLALSVNGIAGRLSKTRYRLSSKIHPGDYGTYRFILLTYGMGLYIQCNAPLKICQIFTMSTRTPYGKNCCVAHERAVCRQRSGSREIGSSRWKVLFHDSQGTVMRNFLVILHESFKSCKVVSCFSHTGDSSIDAWSSALC